MLYPNNSVGATGTVMFPQDACVLAKNKNSLQIRQFLIPGAGGCYCTTLAVTTKTEPIITRSMKGWERTNSYFFNSLRPRSLKRLMLDLLDLVTNTLATIPKQRLLVDTRFYKELYTPSPQHPQTTDFLLQTLESNVYSLTRSRLRL